MKHFDTQTTPGQFVHQVRIQFTSRPLTAWGGLCSLVAKFLEQIQFRDWVEHQLPLQETSPNGRGIYEKVLGQLLTALTGGYRFAHLLWWTHGREAIQACFDVDWLPGAPSVLTRLWAKVNSQAAADQLGRAARQLTGQLLEQEHLTQDNLNLDSSVCERYGRQQGAKRGYNPKKPGRPSHHPLKAFLGSGYVVNRWNRSGDTAAGHRAVEFYRQTVQSLPPGLRIVRTLADSGFYELEFIQYLEAAGRSYIIAVPLWEVFQQQIRRLQHWERVDRGIEVGEFYFQHQDKKWTQPRRYVVVRQEMAQRPQASGKQPSLLKEWEETKAYRYSLCLTNDQESPAVAIWRGYRPRAADENVVKDLKEGYGLAAFSLRSFWATEAVMVLNGLVVHNLIHFLNRKILHRAGPLAQLRTLRLRLFALPAALGRAGRGWVLRLAVRDQRLRGQIRFWLNQIGAFGFRLNPEGFRGWGLGRTGAGLDGEKSNRKVTM